MSGEVDTVVSDHACCMEEMKQGDTWGALPGFGGSSLIYPVLLSEGVHKRGLSLARAAELASTNSAQRYGLFPRKGAIAVGSDADFAIVDMNETRRVSASGLHSAQDHTPFAGMALRGWPVATVLRGRVCFKDGTTEGQPAGEFMRRPAA
jgi:dihydropyrimidinase/allantoinase